MPLEERQPRVLGQYNCFPLDYCPLEPLFDEDAVIDESVNNLAFCFVTGGCIACPEFDLQEAFGDPDIGLLSLLGETGADLTITGVIAETLETFTFTVNSDGTFDTGITLVEDITPYTGINITFSSGSCDFGSFPVEVVGLGRGGGGLPFP